MVSIRRAVLRPPVARLAERLAEQETSIQIANGETIRLYRFEQAVYLDETSGTRDVIDNDTRIARDMLPKMTGNKAGPQIEASPGEKPTVICTILPW